MSIRDDVKKMKMAAPYLAASSIDIRNKALEIAMSKLKESAEKIFEANRQDLEAAATNGVAPAVVKRLRFDEHKLNDVIEGIKMLIKLPDPIGKVSLHRELDEGLELTRVSCPIGVIGVIFEARPDALVQISTLCIKSGNCAILKGGKETTFSNRILFEIIHNSIIEAGLPVDCMLQAESHSEIDELLSCHGYVDLLIPRGSNAFVKYIMDNTSIPVMGHADGICHIYVDDEADFELATKIIIDAKTQYTAACNAVETLLVNRKVAGEYLPKLYETMKNNGIKLRGDKEVQSIIAIEDLTEGGYIEYLDLVASVKIVDDIDEAIEHINRFGSHHTDSIITENKKNADYFMQMVDSAGVYCNCSTRFADGFRYGFGAEVGISTGKIHARGPVGLEGLVTYKYKLYGTGQIVGDYAEGRSHFNFRDIEY
ncbi:MAG: glutamate-5-semialdehyde dehydrogenase [Lachnospiraceae bacterium]|nr:glutamate-5-semialdehyde dehydrogenase [Candidatus Colinaster scatohippi]